MGYYNYFLEKINSGEKLPKLDFLLKGLSTGAFHAVIRLGFAIESKNDFEVAGSLAYLAYAYLPFTGILKADKETGLEESIKNISNIYNKNLKLNLNGVIYTKMIQVSESEINKNILEEINSINLFDLKKIKDFNLNIFEKTLDFTALHLVTSCHAIIIILPFIKDSQSFLRDYFYACVLAIFTVPNIEIDCPKNKIYNIEELKNIAFESLDDHIIKIIYTSIEENIFYSDERFLEACSKYINSKK